MCTLYNTINSLNSLVCFIYETKLRFLCQCGEVERVVQLNCKISILAARVDPSNELKIYHSFAITKNTETLY